MSSETTYSNPVPNSVGLQRIAKRLVDLVLSTVALLFALPIMLVVALAIKLDSRGPIFFNSVRVGLNGRHFKMYKFRTMVADAEERLEGLQAANCGGKFLIRIPNDPRVTRMGQILRKFSLDELPQFLNVLEGDMSIVGPRPQYPREVMYYDSRQKKRLVVCPGITGLWQVTARHSADFGEWIRLDLEYIDKWSIWLDFKIILLTIPAILRGTGV